MPSERECSGITQKFEYIDNGLIEGVTQAFHKGRGHLSSFRREKITTAQISHADSIATSNQNDGSALSFWRVPIFRTHNADCYLKMKLPMFCYQS